MIEMNGVWVMAVVKHINPNGSFCVMAKDTGMVQDNVAPGRVKVVQDALVRQALEQAELPSQQPVPYRSQEPLQIMREVPAPPQQVTITEPKEDVLIEAMKLFDLLDNNKDGYISRAEFERLLPWEQRQLYLVLKKRGNQEECPLM